MDTWSLRANLAANGNWEALKHMQEAWN
jgi:hypothetical protein